MKIERVTLQSLSGDLGEYAAVRSCAPICFYMLLKAYGYLGAEPMTPAAFAANLNRPHLLTSAQDWSRPALSAAARMQFKAPVVSWQLWRSLSQAPDNFSAMSKAGYIETETERQYYEKHFKGKTVEQIVRGGHPAIVTMKPGLGSPENRNIHAVIVASWTDQAVEIIDPDDRNPKTTFAPDHINAYISEHAGVTVILPQSASTS